MQYIPGKYLCITDTLPRAPSSLPLYDQMLEDDVHLRLHQLVTELPVSTRRMKVLQREASLDPVLQQLSATVTQGWPAHPARVSLMVKRFWPVRENVHQSEGLLFCGKRIIIPAAMQQDMLAPIHEGHLGAGKCKARARPILYWPGMSREIESCVAECGVCASFRPANQKEPVIPHSVLDRPWQKLSADIFHFSGKDHLILMDYSKVPEVSQLNGLTAQQ